MLDIKRDRLDYGALLIPPKGYRLDRAVSTTYSADLDTLLSIPIALFYAQTLEGRQEGYRHQILEAIERTSKRVTVYHQKGQLHVPRSFNWLYAYLENVLVPIVPGGAFTSFHAKVWVLRYRADEEDNPAAWRVIVLTRNLTSDRSWDIAVHLEGQPGSHVQPRNRPLVEFLKWLNAQAPFPQSKSFLEDLSKVSFAIPDGFESYTFHSLGIAAYGRNPIVKTKADDLLCLSPFLHSNALETLRDNVENSPSILSRRLELERLAPALLRDFSTYCLSDLVVDGERLMETEERSSDTSEQDLHAKLFLFDSSKRSTWFIGSANATKAAFERNVEFLVELRAAGNSARMETVRRELLGNSEYEGIFVPFEPDDGGQEDSETAKVRATLRKLEYAILKAPVRGCVVVSENGENFDLKLTLDFRGVPKISGFVVEIRPFNTPADPFAAILGKSQKAFFENINETNLSRFMLFAVKHEGEVMREFLLRIEIDDLPPSRLSNIFKTIVNSREKFFEYLRFLLADVVTKEDLMGKERNDNGGKDSSQQNAEWSFDIPIFEQLLGIASRQPRRLAEVDRVIANLSDTKENQSVVPDEFIQFWEVFKSATKPKRSTDA
jgi:hypothetical protein